MNNLKNHIIKVWKDALHSIKQNELADIYAFSFFVYNDEDDPRNPTLTIGYNTNSNFEKQKYQDSDKKEAKWNYAFWLQNELVVMGTKDDETGKRLIQQFLTVNGWNFTDEELNYDLNNCWQEIDKVVAYKMTGEEGSVVENGKI